MSDFARRLKSLRMKKEMSQAELAKALSTSSSTIGMYEQGRRVPTKEGLEEIADFFNVDLDYLTGRSEYTTVIVRRSEIEHTEEFKDAYNLILKATPEQLRKMKAIWKLCNGDGWGDK